MKIDRRKMLLAAAGGATLAATGGMLRIMRSPDASGPWLRVASATDDFRIGIFRHAILAPNPHNRQPWQVRLVGEREAVITCDLDRRLPQTDPFDRQITIGFGAFLELAQIAAAEHGYRAEVDVFPKGAPQPRLDSNPISHIRFEKDASVVPDPLFRAIRLRRSTKEPFDLDRQVPSEALSAFSTLGRANVRFGATTDPVAVKTLRELVVRAFALETNTARTMKESADLLRVGSAEIERNPDGIPLRGPLFEALSLIDASMVRAQAVDPQSMAFKSTLARYERTFMATPAFLWLVSRTNTRADQIEAGRAYVRANLEATLRGLSLAPVSQALQEFPEMQDEYRRVHSLLGTTTGECVQMLARLGYGPQVAPAPRWPLEAKLLKAGAA